MQTRANRDRPAARVRCLDRRRWRLRLGLAALCCLWPHSTPAAEPASDFVRRARIIESAELGLPHPVGLAWSRKANEFIVLSSGSATREIALIANGERRAGWRQLAASISNPLNVAFDNKAHRLLRYDARRKHLIAVAAGRDGIPDPGTLTRIPVWRYGIESAQGMTVDPVTGRLFLLDGAAHRVVVVEPDARGRLARAAVSSVELNSFAPGVLRGLAFDPASGHLHVYRPADRTLYEISDGGRVVASRDLSSFDLRDPQGLVFAPSGDLTDDPLETSLYVAETGGSRAGGAPGQITELSLGPTAQPQAATVGATLVQVIDTSQFSPPSPDAMGLTYVDDSNTLLLTDSEVSEIPTLFTGDNLFDVDPVSGTLLGTSTTLPYSDEPAGAAFNPANGHIFISDDDANDVFEIDPGLDGIPGTGDDTVTSFDTETFANFDPEGIAYDSVQGYLYLVDGVNAEIYEIAPGANGIFDGAAPSGDDQVTSFDTASFGALDPEGITFDWDNGFLYLVGEPTNILYHVTTTGILVRKLDISAPTLLKPSGLAFGPGSGNPTENVVYVSDRGIDNDDDPNENDGQIFEFSIPAITPGNLPPVVDAGPDQAITSPGIAVLEGTVSDPLLPGGVLTTLWSQVSGPGTAVFADASQEDTTATFAAAGTYVLRLTGNDGELSGSDDIIVTATGSAGETTTEIGIVAGSQDAEEHATGTVSLTSSDIELTFDNVGFQTVGLRFLGVDIPPSSSIVEAFVQFTVDEPNSVATFLLVEGEAADYASTFLASAGNISSRPRTAAQVPWQPVPWLTAGEASFDQRTPNLAPIIEEIVARPGWSAGNALALIVTGAGERTADSFDSEPDKAAFLRVFYVPPPNGPPTADIQAPLDGAGYDEGEPVDFTGSASDPEEGDITASLAWSSSLDGPIGVGGSFMRSDLSVGVHTITTSVTDSAGASGSAQVGITVGCAGADADGDGFADGCDNCIAVSNPSQTDSNGDGFGNACDADYDGDLMVGLADFGVFLAAFGLTCGDPGWDPDLDSNDDCSLALGDFGLVLSSFGLPPGPSAFAP